MVREAQLSHDKSGEQHFDLISALHKSLRNSDAQAALYWMARMLEAGEHPGYVIRRMIRFASEDVGMADPQALVQANAAAVALDRLGMPEANLALAQCCVYLAQAPKSDALYRGYAAAAEAVRQGPRVEVPLHLRNAPTALMRETGYGDGYQNAHRDPEGVAPMAGLPEPLTDTVFYRPGGRGFEAEVADRLRHSWRLARRARPTAKAEDDAPDAATPDATLPAEEDRE